MKTTIKKYLVVVVMMLGTLMNYANVNSNSIDVVKGKKVRLEYRTVKKGHTLSIKNENGTVIYTQVIKNTGSFSQIFDLSKLEKGNYTTELEKDFEIIVKYFTVNEGEISFNDEKTIFKPVIRAEDDTVYVSKITFDNEPVKVELYYENEIIFSETVTNTEDVLSRVYKVSKEIKGDYKVVIKSDNRSYEQDFNL
ncbi:hypothetical protein BXQ17_11735 [Polaribacter sp. BM10]|uniref:DUF3244 domain-containing protein n=1 Tax=Polaribacter sp. BM10 TaxID=1529069 RepID=UPI00098B1B1E|nr:DUF3244 domain-containing protein [Polaribacter sp. BM10]AQS94703.1 hypothetical protein BXQ17_11735 [Polaribacter sp. BM10]